MGTKNNPAPFDCYANAEPDEPMFILLGRDPAASFVVRLWTSMRRAMGSTSDTKLTEAEACAAAMKEFAKQRGKAEQVELASDVFYNQIVRETHG